MRVLIIHNEARYFGGAETVLGHYLSGVKEMEAECAVAAVGGSRVMDLVPGGMLRVPISDNGSFSVLRLCQQARTLLRLRRQFPFDLVHGWSARDWELSALVGFLARRPAMGTLHDHPAASFISPARRRLMRWCARFGLDKVACVSSALRQAGLESGYDATKLTVIHNGIPNANEFPPRSDREVFQLGFLGVFSERKGLRCLFQALPELHRAHPGAWQLHLAGDAQEAEGRRMMAEIRAAYESAPWWPQIHWHGWVDAPETFLAGLDLLICPSSQFEPFGMVIIEAGQMSVPVLAARIGGVVEIVEEGKTGWLFTPGDHQEAARLLVALLADPSALRAVRRAAWQRATIEFTVGKMVAQYRELYSIVCRHGH